EATRHQRGSLLDAALDQALDLVELDLAHHWSELRVLQAWIAHLVSFRGPLCYLQRLVMARCRHEHAGRRIAGLAAIAEAGIHALAHGALEVGVGQYDVCRFAAQLLRYALDRIGRRLGNDDSGAGRAREGDHVDIRMACHDLADIGPGTVDHVVHALGRARRFHDLGKDDAADRWELGGLQQHGAGGGDGRGHLADYLVERPVPWRDEGADADWLLHHHGGAALYGELVIFQCLDGGFQVRAACPRLRLARPGDR